MKKKKLWVSIAIAVAVVLIGWGWFARPMTIEQMFPGFSWADAAEHPMSFACVYRQQDVYPDGHVDTVNLGNSGMIDLTEPGFAALVEQLEAAKFSRSLLGTLRERYRPAMWSVEDLDPYLLDVDFNTGALPLYIRAFDGLTISYGGTTYRCSMGGHQELMDDFFAYVKAYENNKE